MKLTCHKDKKFNSTEEIKFRPINEDIINKINNELISVDWNILNDMDTDEGYNYVINKITVALDLYPPEIFFKKLSIGNTYQLILG